MGQENYILRTGVQFDVDKRSGANAESWMETIAEGMNTKQLKIAVVGIQQRNSKLKELNNKLDNDNKAATKKRVKDVEKSSGEMQNAIQKGLPPVVTEKAVKAGKKSSEDRAAFVKDMEAMGGAYEKFAKRAEKMGMKVGAASKRGGVKGGFGTGGTTKDFGKEEAEDRARQINLTKTLIDENKILIKVGGKGAEQAKIDNEWLIKQENQMIKLDKEAINLEKKEQKIKRKNFKQFKKDAAVEHRKNKQAINDIKTRGIAWKKAGQAMGNYAGGIKSGMKNAFVIGTAAVLAFGRALQPVVESVMDFEKTIINANSVFGESNEVLHEVSDSLVTFGLQYGVSTNKAAEGLYQLASAGLSAAESQEVLQHTLKLAMATQGDHNTLAKLTVQTIKGFGFEMDQAGELTDKFAHTIQKSLVEWQDLSSSVKFAMPFFTATGQSIDQLLGGIEVLSNRALEAGIAGRGLRQALAQFAKHANDNESALAKLGVTIMDTEGNMRELHEIAKDAKTAFGDVTDLEALTAMLEDMNVRGATAFALLVQNADEFESAVSDLQNSAGEATRMADIQQQSLANQIQRVKNALIAPFFFADKIGEAGDSLNEFTLRIKELVDEFVGFLIIEEEGTYKLTEMSYAIQDFVIATLKELLVVIRKLKKVFLETAGDGGGLETFTRLMQLSTKPLLIMLDILDRMSPRMLEYLVWYKVAAKLLPLSTFLTMMNARAQMMLGLAIAKQNGAKVSLLSLYFGEFIAMKLNTLWKILNYTATDIQNRAEARTIMLKYGLTTGIWANTMAWVANHAAILGPIAAVLIMYAVLRRFVDPIASLTIALVALAAAWVAMWAGATLGIGAVVAIAAMAAGIAAVKKFFPEHSNQVSDAATMSVGPSYKHTKLEAQGARSYDMGGVYLGTAEMGMMSTEHGFAQVQKGETINSKTGNMVGDIPITLNMGDVNVQDGEDFAERVASALPDALRSATEGGQI